MVIFQDNLACHGSDMVVEFCVSKGIHLYNFPPKTSHIIQPLDKMFNNFKTTFDRKKQDAKLVYKNNMGREKIPALTRFTMQATSKESIESTFRITGLCPFNREAITSGVLVEDGLTPASRPSGENSVPRSSLQVAETPSESLDMEVFDENNNP